MLQRPAGATHPRKAQRPMRTREGIIPIGRRRRLPAVAVGVAKVGLPPARRFRLDSPGLRHERDITIELVPIIAHARKRTIRAEAGFLFGVVGAGW